MFMLFKASYFCVFVFQIKIMLYQCALLFFLLPAVIYCGSGTDWDYVGIHGPDHWHEDYPNCKGVMQSPIGIEPSKAIYDPSLLQFGFKGFEDKTKTNMTMKNNGHTVQVDIIDPALRTHGGGLNGGYKAVQFHFHWGHNNSLGSEHVLNDKQYPMEMHIVHYSEKFQTFNDAVDKPDGLMVLGFFFEVGMHNYHFEEVFKYLELVAHKDDETVIPPIVMERLVPIDLIHFYRYRGSLTTPPCHESVVWTVFEKPIQISAAQMNTFRNKIKKNIVNETDEPLTDDFRPVQPLSGRSVFVSYELNPPASQPSPTQTPAQPIFICGSNGSNGNSNTNSAGVAYISKLLFLFYIFVVLCSRKF